MATNDSRESLTEVVQKEIEAAKANPLKPMSVLTKRFKERKIPTKLPSLPKFNKKASRIAKIAIVLLIGAFFLLTFLKVLPREEDTHQDLPTPTEKPIPTKILSPYATDSAVLEIEKSLRETEKLLNDTKFRELPLLPPKIDTSVEF